MGELPNELPQDRWFWVWLTVFGILLGTSPFIIWDHRGWGIICGVTGLAGLLVLVRDRLAITAKRLPVRGALKVMAVVAFSILIGQVIGYDIYNPHANRPLAWSQFVLAAGFAASALAAIGISFSLFKAILALNGKPATPSKLVIHSALYGVGDATDIDLTEKLNGIAKEGLIVPVNNNLVDHDPSPNKFKRLKIRYQYDAGEPHTVTLPEHSWLMLPENPQLLKLQSDIEALQKRIDSTQEAPQFSDLAKRTLNLASRFQREVKEFRAQHPQPRFPSRLGRGFERSKVSSPIIGTDDVSKAMAEFNAWKERAGAWYRSRFMPELERLRDELGVQGMSDGQLNTALTETSLDPENTKLIVRKLRFLALQLEDDPQERAPNDVTLQLAANDPRIRLETLSVPSDTPGFTSDRFVLHNEGGSTAYRVKIEDLDLTNSKFGKVLASFQAAETILTNAPAVIAPVIHDTAISLPGQGLAIFLKWATEPSLAGKNVLVTYYDYNDNEFKTAAELVYAPLAPETVPEIAKDFADVAGQYLRKNPLEVIVERKERRGAGVSEIAVRNLRYWKVGKK